MIMGCNYMLNNYSQLTGPGNMTPTVEGANFGGGVDSNTRTAKKNSRLTPTDEGPNFDIKLVGNCTLILDLKRKRGSPHPSHHPQPWMEVPWKACPNPGSPPPPRAS